MSIKRFDVILAVLGLSLMACFGRVLAAPPEPLELVEQLPDSFRPYAGTEPEQLLLRSEFYPIGWSQNSYFAYMIEPPDEACGCYLLRTKIQDMKTDKLLWAHNYISAEAESALVPGTRPETLEAYWKTNAAALSKQFKQFGIQQGHAVKLETGELRHDKDRLQLSLTTATDKTDDMITHVRVDLLSQDRGRKTIYDENYGPASGIYAVSISGWLRSPHEPRVAVVLTELRRGWEGPPHVMTHRLIGAKLTSGFAKDK